MYKHHNMQSDDPSWLTQPTATGNGPEQPGGPTSWALDASPREASADAKAMMPTAPHLQMHACQRVHHASIRHSREPL